VFLGAVIYNQWPYWTGQTIVLATRPVDPFDPFRGQYIIINYEISRITGVAAGFSEGDLVYVRLKEDDSGVSRFDTASRTKPTAGEFIRGTVTSAYGDTVTVTYGIEQFFFEQNAQVPTINLTIEVMVSSGGRAKIKQLLQNGQRVNITYQKFDWKS
jgi:uncharacterized membrane-anchored protein